MSTVESTETRISVPMSAELAVAIRQVAEIDDRSQASVMRLFAREGLAKRRLVDAAFEPEEAA